MTKIAIILLLLNLTPCNVYSLDTLQNKVADYSIFFDSPIENIKILSGSGWG